MQSDSQHLGEEYIKLSFGMEEYFPGYVDAYYGPEEWKIQANQDGKLPLDVLTKRTSQLADDVFKADMDEQRKDFLIRQIGAMQMSQRLLAGEKVSLAEEVEAIYDVRPEWKDEASFEEAHKELDALLPQGGSLTERQQAWKSSLEISIEKSRELFPYVIRTCRELASKKFNIPNGESFSLELVNDKPWMAYNWYLGNMQSRIDINTDIPVYINMIAPMISHEGYPGHHTELTIKEQKLVKEKGYYEHTIALINSPSCVISEGIAMIALDTIFSDTELEDWYRDELLPRAGMSHVDAKRMLKIVKANDKMMGISGNISFMLYDERKSESEVEKYLQKYALATDREIKQMIRFVSDPPSRSYVFTYDVGYDLLMELFTLGDRDAYLTRLFEEPVPPSQIRQWIN